MVPVLSLVSATTLIRGLHRTAVSFPLPAVLAVAFAALLFATLRGIVDTDDRVFGVLIKFLPFAFPLALTVRFVAALRGLSIVTEALITTGLLTALVARIYLLSGDGGRHLSLGPVLVLLLMAAPFLAGRADDRLFWQFNRALGTAILFATVVATTAAVGLFAALSAVAMLFDRPLAMLFDRPLIEMLGPDTMVLCFGLVLPLVALGQLPAPAAARLNVEEPRWIAALTAYVLVPLAIGYLAILYAYLGWVVWLRDLPDGQTAALVIGYAVYGVVTYFVAYPLRDTGAAHVRLFHRHFFHALAPLVLLLAVATWVRIDAYGVTEARYLLGMFTVWLAVLTAVFTIMPARHLAAAPLVLAVFLEVASSDAVGARTLSIASQVAKLDTLLTRDGLLVDRRINPNTTLEDREQLRSIFFFLQRRGELARVQTHIDLPAIELPEELGDLAETAQILDALGLADPTLTDQPPRFFEYQPIESTGVDPTGFSTMTTTELRANSPVEVLGGTFAIALDEQSGTVSLTGSGQTADFDVGALARRLTADDALPRTLQNLTLEPSDGELAARLVVINLKGNHQGDKFRVLSVDAILLIEEPPA